MIIPLIEGTHRMQEAPDGVDIYDHTSAVTLIKTDTTNILVDTGGRGQIENIRERLQEQGLTLEDIHIVILTHFHLDHVYNVSFFANSRVIGWQHEWKNGATFRFKDIEALKIAEDVSIIKTPGHTTEHLSVKVEESGKTTIVAGDAINEKFYTTEEMPAVTADKELYKKSAEWIKSVADVIIPGHGGIITRPI